ncbi:autotransporter outer membrane beta-barrel domain-containing protein [Escherichia coli]|uniref:autotransporter outer membrane beta-barrel domain-containing protein n=1 Tax=Escherichia coli TaxID=562 RepID=UPI0010740CCE|nr:autotransporter outer membrane beta-barrel domain-containing protein [Escherichia coli]TFW05128.1 autotransporter outer membrane beta-barrel domain-containing protein [Escherichia coli]
MNRIYRVIWNCTLQVFQACSELTRRVGKTSTVNLRKSSGLTTKFSRLTLGVLLALSGSVSGASLEVDNGQITNIDTDVAYDAYLVGWYGTGVLNILAGGNAALTTITTSVIGGNEDSEGTVNVLGGTWRLYDSGNNARPLNVGQSGTGTLNIKQKGHVDGGYLRLGTQTAGVGTVNVEGEDSVLTTELFEIGSYGTGSLNITDKGYVTSSIVAILGYQAGSNGQVVVEKGGEWLIKNNDSSIEFQIGNQGTGEATIREGGLVTAENTIIGGNATGIGTLNVQDQDSVITVRRLYNGYFGNGTVNISNNGLINNKEYSLVGVQDGSHGVVNVTDKGHWNFLGTGEAFRYIYIGDAGDGELNVSSEGKVDSGIITAGMKETGTGNITVKDKNSVITNLGTNLGYDGHGEMNISNQGLVVSNGGSSLGYGETGVGNVSITTGGMWEVNKNVYTTIGVAGVGNLNISDGGKFVSQNITFLGDKASGIGTLNLMDATSSFDTVGINVGNFGSGIVNVSNGATLNSTGYGFIGGNASGKGIVNISTDSLWNLKTSSTNAQLLQVGVLGTGELNITTGGIVKARDTQIALNDKSKGDVRVDGQNSLLETFNMYVGTSGTGTLTLTNSGTLNVEGGEVYLGVFEPAVGTLNIGAAHGEAAADAGYITNATKVEFGSGEGVFVFNHTNNSDAGYQVDMLNTQANRYVLQLGGDLAQWSSNAQDRWHLGVMAGYANQHSNTQSNRVGYKSDGRISGYSAGLYATWYQNDANKTGAYVDSWALYNWFDNSVSSDNRSADDYDSRGVTASVEGGYTFEAGTFSGSEGTLNTWYVQPQAQITWMGVKDSDHTRKDGTRIETEGDGNVQTRLGVKTYLNSHHQRDDGKQREFQPYIEANWINNSKVYAVKMNGQTVGREGARNLGEVRTGVEAKVNNNLSLWGNVGVQLGDKGYSDTQGMLGVKYSW